ncbi:hypothetical protein BST63_06295 [Bradyrhizobium canariense]|uniref:Uncharacterized protein n=1 Tax=Bradyrhizobium canariense TaxID=255045 RepID=A0ABX3X9R2_9BRAD|nr:hypothetical protein BSR47_26280 [Bradyrhizobium canariense]OSJ33020.1 hypothetical protein BST63_06295 [Bradyrhizobium canariense]
MASCRLNTSSLKSTVFDYAEGWRARKVRLTASIGRLRSDGRLKLDLEGFPYQSTDEMPQPKLPQLINCIRRPATAARVSASSALVLRYLPIPMERTNGQLAHARSRPSWQLPASRK